jgi:hypothetical protein
LGGATSFERGDDTDDTDDGDDSGELCGGLVLDITLASNRRGQAQMEFAITNNTDYGWHGSVRVGSTPIPIDIGEVEPGETETDRVDLDLDADSSYDIEGSLLIGP